MSGLAADHRLVGQGELVLLDRVVLASLHSYCASLHQHYTNMEYAKASSLISAANRSIGSTTGCTITEKAPTRAFS